uniref:uncharacterized protein LOC123459459 n=1 Tax=Jaculus jaculus TaxID=51337 RepID=UPI001E1B5577|nr:uncharacterized protein LOC123459459 [Jaculus jaculus]
MGIAGDYIRRTSSAPHCSDRFFTLYTSNGVADSSADVEYMDKETPLEIRADENSTVDPKEEEISPSMTEHRETHFVQVGSWKTGLRQHMRRAFSTPHFSNYVFPLCTTIDVADASTEAEYMDKETPIEVSEKIYADENVTASGTIQRMLSGIQTRSYSDVLHRVSCQHRHQRVHSTRIPPDQNLLAMVLFMTSHTPIMMKTVKPMTRWLLLKVKSVSNLEFPEEEKL